MIYYHGVAIEPTIIRNGHMFVAFVHIMEEDGETTSLGELGQFAGQACRLANDAGLGQGIRRAGARRTGT